MKILAGTQRKRKTPASFTVTTPETDAGPEAAGSPSAEAVPAKSSVLAKVIWGLVLLSLAESMVLAGMVYRMPMEQPVDQTEVQPDPEQAQVVLTDQASLLGLTDKGDQAAAAVPSYDIGPIHYPAVTRLEDADIPGLPANLAKQQQSTTAGSNQAVPETTPAPLPKEKHPDLPAPDEIPRAKMPVLDFHSILEQALPADTKPPAAPVLAPDKSSRTPSTPAAQPRARAPEQSQAAAPEQPRAAAPEQPQARAASPGKPSAPIELYRPGGSPAAQAMPPAGSMRITPHPAPASRADSPAHHRSDAAVTAPVEMHGTSSAKAHASPDAATPPAHPWPAPASQEPVDAAPHHATQAPHGALPSDERPLPSEAMAPRRHLPRPPGPGPAWIDRPPVIAPPPPVPPPARLGPPRIIVPVRPILPRPPILLDRPPGLMPERPEGGPPRGPHLAPREPDADAPAEDQRGGPP